MSSPRHPHRLAQEQERGAGGEYVAARFAQMRCDGGAGDCIVPPERAPLIVVPAASSLKLGLPDAKREARALARIGVTPKPLKGYTTLHFCRRHWNFAPAVTIEALLTPAEKRHFERLAKRAWSHEFRPDFDAAFIDWVLVSMPEYRAYLLELERRAGVTFRGMPVL